jgi:predicted XRE-type DNA-binding protein
MGGPLTPNSGGTGVVLWSNLGKMMNNDLTLTPANENIFLDLGFDREEASCLKIRADLMLDLQAFIRSKDWAMEEAAHCLNETPFRINHLMGGEIGEFDIEQLITLLEKAGMETRIEVFPKAA